MNYIRLFNYGTFFAGKLFFMALFLLSLGYSFGQDTEFQTALSKQPLAFSAVPDTTPTQLQNSTTDEDTTEEIVKPKLLPDNISMGEKFFWGEHGLWRQIGLSSQLTPEVRKHELNLRRTMLSVHQISGFAALAMMMTTCYYGQRIIDGHRNLSNEKDAFVTGTILTYTFTGLLSILSPPPMIRRSEEESTITTHKYLAYAHVLGMIITPLLADNIREHVPGTKKSIFNMDRAHIHQLGGYITTALFAAAMITVTF